MNEITAKQQQRKPAKKKDQSFGGKYLTPAPFEWHPTGLPLVYAGRQFLYPADADRLKAETPVGLVIDLREPKEWTAPNIGGSAIARLAELGVLRVNFATKDVTPLSKAHLGECVELIGDAVERGIAVYIHCRAGKERTASLLLAYAAKVLQRDTGKDLAECVQQAAKDLTTSYKLYRPTGSQVDRVLDWLGVAGAFKACYECRVLYPIPEHIGSFTCKTCWNKPKPWERGGIGSSGYDWNSDPHGFRRTESQLEDWRDPDYRASQGWDPLPRSTRTGGTVVSTFDPDAFESSDRVSGNAYKLCGTCGYHSDQYGWCDECGRYVNSRKIRL